MENKTLVRDMTVGKLFPMMISFTLPFMLANLLQTLYTVADLAIVGHCGQDSALAAVSISSQVTVLLTLISAMVANGGQIYIAQLIGQKRKDELNAAIGTFFSFSLILAVFATVLGVGFARPLLRWMNTPEVAMGPAVEYLVVCSLGFIFVFGYNSVCAVLRGMGESKAPTVFVAVTAGVNVLGDLLLVLVFDMGAMGAAIATVLSQAAAFFAALRFLYRRRAEAGFDFKASSFAMKGDKLAVMVRLSLPLVVMQFAINLSMMYINSHINDYGVAAAAISGIGNKLYGVVNMVSSAFGSALATIVGQNMGAGRHDRVRQGMFLAVCMNLCFFALVAAVSCLFPRSVFRIFTNDPDILALAAQYLRIAIWAYLAFALMQPALGLMNGVGATGLSLCVGVLDGVVARIGLSLGLGAQYGMWGYFWGYCLAGLVSAILGWLYFFSGRWKHRKPL